MSRNRARRRRQLESLPEVSVPAGRYAKEAVEVAMSLDELAHAVPLADADEGSARDPAAFFLQCAKLDEAWARREQSFEEFLKVSRSPCRIAARFVGVGP